MKVIPEAAPALNNSRDSSFLVSAPAFSFTLHFLDPRLESQFQQFVREKSQGNFTLAPNIKERYLLFCLLFFAMMTIMALSYLADYLSLSLSGNEIAIQFAGLLVMFCIAVVCIILAYSMNVRTLLASVLLVFLFVSASALFTVIDTAVLHKLLNGDQINPALVGMIPVLVTLVAMQYLFVCDFLVYSLTSIANVVIYLCIHFAVMDKGSSQIVLEFGVLIACCVFMVRRTFTMERSVRIAFLLDLNENQNRGVKSSKSSNSVPANSSISHNSEIEDILNRISHVHAAITDACAVISFQDIRAKLRNALRDLDVAANKLSIQSAQSQNVVKVEPINEDIDEEDRIFVQQNYMASKASDFIVPTVEIAKERDVETMALTLEYGLSELLAVMNQLGKNWNFDIFFVHEITKGKPLSVTGRFCLSKFDLTTKFNISDKTAENFFTAMESQYKNNPYHNSSHGADVLNSTFFLYNHSFIIGHMTDVEILGAVIATLGHDVGHGALTNRFLVNNRDGVALTCK